jgi:hypothetical protein
VEESRAKSVGWGLSSFLLVVLMLCVEGRFANELWSRLHSYFLSSTRHKGDLVFFIATMLFIPVPLLIGFSEVRATGKTLGSLGVDEKAISSRQSSIMGILFFSYMTLNLCVGAISDLLPLP